MSDIADTINHFFFDRLGGAALVERRVVEGDHTYGVLPAAICVDLAAVGQGVAYSLGRLQADAYRVSAISDEGVELVILCGPPGGTQLEVRLCPLWSPDHQAEAERRRAQRSRRIRSLLRELATVVTDNASAFHHTSASNVA
jgi:hypothetical protein